MKIEKPKNQTDLRLDYGIGIKCERVSVKNKFGRIVNYGQWSISKKPNDLKLIEKKYNKINK